MFFERYNKKIMEPFALNVISKSFDCKYAEYSQPSNTDEFDFLSPDGLHALEVVSVFTKNEREAYQYEVQLSRGKYGLKSSRIKGAFLRDDGSLFSYYGGSLHTIIDQITQTFQNKCNKAIRRQSIKHYKTIDLCICVQDGSLMDLHSYQIAGFNFEKSPFDNIFFITPSYFFRFNNTSGFEEYVRVV